MGIEDSELKKIPNEMTVRECYEKIYFWHKQCGVKRVKEKRDDDSYRQAYLRLLDKLIEPKNATQADMDFIFGMVIFGLMEWAYHEADDHGIKTAAYAHFAVSKNYLEGINDEKFRRSREASKLFSDFGTFK